MITGRYFAPNSSRAEPATLARDGQALRLVVAGQFSRDIEITASSEPLARLPRRFSLSDGGLFEAPFDADFASIGIAAQSRISRWENAPRMAAAFLALTIMAAASLWIWGIPFAADLAAAQTSPALLRKMDVVTLESLEEKAAFSSHLPQHKQARLQALFSMLVQEAQIEDLTPRLLIRTMPRIGPNAFALPGGTILLSDELVDQSKRDDEIAGVLAHELGHVKLRHIARQLYSSLGLSTLISMIAAGPGPVIESALSAGTAILNLTYSRDFEREADLHAARMMHKIGMDPTAFVDLLERVEKTRGSAGSDWLSTHPGTQNRREHLRNSLKD